MNYKYFGNSLDLMKYDILTHLLKSDDSELFYVPMLTEPEPKKLDPKYKVYEIGTKNKALLELMLLANELESQLDVADIRSYFKKSDLRYKIILDKAEGDKNTITMSGIGYFAQENRIEYFSKAIDHFVSLKSKSLVFIDPCVGLDIGVNRRVRSMRELYLTLEELKFFIHKLKVGDTICYFQHLGNPIYDINSRLKDLKSILGEFIMIIGYKRISACLILIFKTEKEYEEKKLILRKYLEDYQKIKYFDKVIFL